MLQKGYGGAANIRCEDVAELKEGLEVDDLPQMIGNLQTCDYIKGLQEAVSDRGIPVPDPGFSLEEDIPTGDEED